MRLVTWAMFAATGAGLLGAAPFIQAPPGTTGSRDSALQFQRFVVRVRRVQPTESTGVRDPEVIAKSAAATALGAGWQVQAFSPESREFGVVPDRRKPRTETTGDANALSLGAAWDEAYELQQQPGVEHAEPVFMVAIDPGEELLEEECYVAAAAAPDRRETLRGALEDHEWSLGPTGANVTAAWRLFAPGIQPGSGIIVGHPDTGYRRHPELANGGALLATDGWDFVDNDADPFDETPEGLLRVPGHGTRTASVIVSRSGSQIGPGAKRWVSGVAPGAQLVPLRVARGVILLDPTNLASAIRSASGDSRNLVKRRADVISISLGGVPSRTLRDALRLAERNNVIVLAAAGNQVKKVVWPARYEGVVAVAASNAASQPWKGSSAGRRVDISAPGESVWCASTRVETSGVQDCLQMSSGTSYAVATAAGAAALWLSYHRDSPRLRDLRTRSAIPYAFRQVLRQAFRPVDAWRTDRYGPGILNAENLLRTPLPPPPPPVESALSACDADLEAMLSLFDERLDARRRAAALFGVGESALCSAADVGDEIALLYATNSELRDNIDALAAVDEPARESYAATRTLLGRLDVSRRLRDVLTTTAGR